jgi:hypothetical protein
MTRPVDTTRVPVVLELELELVPPVLVPVAWLVFLVVVPVVVPVLAPMQQVVQQVVLAVLWLHFWVALPSETTTRTTMPPTPMQCSSHAEKVDAGDIMANTKRLNRICCIENLFRL